MDKDKQLKDAMWIAHGSLLLFFAFFLSIKNAYSLAMGLTLVAALWQFIGFKFKDAVTPARQLAVFLFFLAVFWSHSFDSALSWSTEGDYFIKYALGAFCALVLVTNGFHPRILALSLALGSLFAGVLALLQFPELGRSEGYTNAIKFGDIAIYMGVSCWILAMVKINRASERIFLIVCGGMGLVASLLSLSRGGWAVLLVFPLLVMYFVPQLKHKIGMFTGMVLAIALIVAGMSQVPALQNRFHEAEVEVSGYFQNPDRYVKTSIGARLEQWRLSWSLGAAKPLTGWGEQGYYVGKEEYIAQGKFRPFLREIHHSHNDFLDMWAKRGVVGVVALALIYLIPLFIFYPTPRRTSKILQESRSIFIALSLIGVLLPVSYFIFGLSDVFFNLTIGHNFYIFTMIFILGALNWVKNNKHCNFIDGRNVTRY